MSNDGLFTDGTDQFAPKVNSIPLSDVDASSSETSIGKLVSNATEQMSQLVRSEVELAKTELAQSAKKGGIGAGFFGAAGTIALYSSFFFFFFFLAELLALWLERWAAFLIVFLVMIVAAGALALLGVKNVKKVKAPQKTIDSTKELKNLIPGKAQKSLDRKDTHGLYT